MIKLLQSSGTLKIERAEMKVRIQIPVKEAKKLKEKVYKLIKTKYGEEFDTDFLEIVSLNHLKNEKILVIHKFFYVLKLALIDPGQYREMEELLNTETKGKARLEIVSFKETAEGDETLE